jgi:hypothetical protein
MRIRTTALACCAALGLSFAGAAAATAAPAPTAGSRPASAPPSGAFADLGTPLSSLTIMQGVFAADAAGNQAVYAVPAGENAQLNIVDPVTNTLEEAIPLPGASGSWAITAASDGRIYVGSYSNGELYQYDPATDQVADLGQPVPGEQYIYGLTPGLDGKVYGGTYPHAHAFAYDPTTGKSTDYGSLSDTEKYARSAAFDSDDNALYVGLATPTAKIIRVDAATGARQDVTPPAMDGKQVSDMAYADGKVFANVDNNLWVIDAATNTAVSLTNSATGQVTDSYPVSSRLISPPRGGAVYFTGLDRVLARFDLVTDTITPLESDGAPVTVNGAGIAYGWITVDGKELLYCKYGNYSGAMFSYDPQTGVKTDFTAPFRYVPSPLENVIVDPQSQQVYVNAFLNGSTMIYDPATGVSTATARLGQVEGWVWLDGKLYAGSYPDGRIDVLDPTAPESPTTLFSLNADYGQNRPDTLLATPDRLYIATTPGYGLYGGALTVYDFATKTFAVHRDVVPDQTVASLVLDGDTLFGGSSIDGGQGTDPIASEAKLFTWDTATGSKTGEYTPVPGARSINELTLGPDGNIWGMADGTLFVFDPKTDTVVDTVSVFSGGTSPLDGALVWHPNGHLYGVDGGRLFVVDPLSMTATVLRESGLRRLALADSGVMYTLLTPSGADNATDLASYTPDADPCGAADISATVSVDDVDSGVANRFTDTGCTLADLIPDARDWPTHGAFVHAMTALTYGWARQGLITQAEAGELLSAAADSDVGR